MKDKKKIIENSRMVYLNSVDKIALFRKNYLFDSIW